MDIVTGALGSVLSKIAELLKHEYYLQTRVREKITSLSRELENMHAALRNVAEVPWNELDEQVKLWARDVRELSYTAEDILDQFPVRVEAGRNRKNPSDVKWYDNILELFSFSQAKARREISRMIDIINEKAIEVVRRRERYTIDSIVAKSAAKNGVDPRLNLMYREVTQLVGIEQSRGELISMLRGDDVSSKNIVRVVAKAGGLGKTTLAKVSYDELKSSYDCSAFVSVGQKADFSKVFKDILFYIDQERNENIHNTGRGLHLLITELQEFLNNKRYFIVIDDIWELDTWVTIKQALVGHNCGSRIMITTRKLDIIEKDSDIYMLQPLPKDIAKKLFYTRLFGDEEKCPNNHPEELSGQILRKCGGVTLAIITMASLLLNKTTEEWIEVCKSPGFCQDWEDGHMENTIHILALSYYDLPSHLKTCLLYLSVFPEDSLIGKDSLIRIWIAEGFIKKKLGRGPFELGEEYFHELINRSMIQGVDSEVYGIMACCRVHDMVLDLIVLMSREENFACADGTLSESHTLRLTPKNVELDLTQDTHVNLPQLRSFILLRCTIVKWALHPRLELIRVLALENCIFREGCHSLKDIENLLHLRYLGIQDLWFEELPQGIGTLKFLETLNLERIGYLELPCSIGRLSQLVCLRAQLLRAPDGIIGRLTSLEELQIRGPKGTHKDNGPTRQFVKDLGNLCELRVLKIDETMDMDGSMQIDLVHSLGNLKKMQHLTLADSIGDVNMNAWDAVVPSCDLRCLFLPYIRFHKLPSWIKSTHLNSLFHLDIFVYDLDEQGLKAVGELPELYYLTLYTGGAVTRTNTESDGCFQKLRSLVLQQSMIQFVANKDSSASFTICHINRGMTAGRSRKKDRYRVGAPPVAVMPKLEDLEFCVGVKELMQNNVVSCEDLGLEYLPSVHKVKIKVWCGGAYKEDVEREEAALKHAVEVHPNRPLLQIVDLRKEDMKRRLDDDASVELLHEECQEKNQ